MAPEQVTGHSGGPLTDIYALGIILYEILTGKCPYEGPDSLTVLLQVRTGRMKPPSELRGDIPRRLETICLKATAAAPGERYQTAATLARAVEDWLADELARSETALRESEEQVRLLLDSTAEAIYGTDMDGNCIFCNPACVHMLGYQNPRDLLGKHMHNLMHHHRADGRAYPVEECHIYQAFREGCGTHIIDEVYWHADGTPFPVEYWSYPVRRDGQLIGCVVSFLDITERINRERELILATQTANQPSGRRANLENLQRQFRVSLGETVATTARLHDAELSAEQRGCLEGVTTSLQGLLALTGPHAGGQKDIL